MRIFYNARIYTLLPKETTATAMAIEGDRIIAVGNDTQILAEESDCIERIDLQGKTIWPGLTDAHFHLEHYALSLKTIDCETDTLDDCLQLIAERIAKSSNASWILGHGWDQNSWGGEFGNAYDLDRVASNIPVCLTAKSMHASWVNTVALKKAGITSSTPDPEGGKIQRDAKGHPTGILFENAMRKVKQVIPSPTIDEVSNAILNAQSNLWQFGITGVHDYDQVRCFSALQILNQNELLQLRVVKGIPLEEMDHAIAIGLRSDFGNHFLRIGSVKLFADGALGTHTAAMFEPYENEVDNIGILFLNARQIQELGQRASANGLSLAIHAIGDRANHEALNAYERLREFEVQNNLPKLRHRIEHVQILHPNDINRLARLGITASMQPIHATSDMFVADALWGERSANAYPFRSLLDCGTSLAFGSDAPVESPNPFWGLHAAVTRQQHDGKPGLDGWYPDQRLTLLEALKAYTIGPAYCAGLENQLGKLFPGSLADLIVLDTDPFSIKAQNIYQIHPVATMIGGKWVYQS